jgi:hypothetical protein
MSQSFFFLFLFFFVAAYYDVPFIKFIVFVNWVYLYNLDGC